MRPFSVLLISLFILKTTKAIDHKGMDIAKLVTQADVIVYGQIIDLKESAFVFEIEGSLTQDTGIIEVVKFIDWEWASRWTKYERHQCMLLFLRKKEDQFHIIGGQNDGEFPIIESSIYIPSSALPIPPPPPLDGTEVDSSILFFTPTQILFDSSKADYFYGIEWDFANLISDIEFIRGHLHYQNKYSNSQRNWTLIGNKEDVFSKIPHSKIIAWCFRSKLGIQIEKKH